MKKLILVLTLFTSITCSAQYASNKVFEYSGAVSTLHGANWNPAFALSKGWRISFWGSTDPGAGCSNENGLINGPTSNLYFWDLVADTGVTIGALHENFSPVSNTPQCANKNWMGYSHSHLKQNSDSNGPAGFGLYTHSGPKPNDPGLAFFQPYGTAGDHSGSNKWITATFVSYSCYASSDCPTQNIVYPFMGNSTNNDLLRVAIVSSQGLVNFSGEDLSQQQIRQEMTVNFLSTSSGSQVQYLMMNAIKGIYEPTITSDALLDADPSQGGMIYVAGPIGSTGMSTNSQGYPVWTSWGESTQQATWAGQKTFQVEISFNQFLNVIKLATSKKLNKPSVEVTHADMVAQYGANYNNPNDWSMNTLAVAHEVFNPVWASKRAVVGGNVTNHNIIALPF